MTNILKYDVVVVKFPFASSLTYKARPAVIVSSSIYNSSKRETLLIMAISSSQKNKLDFEINLKDWESSGLLKSSIFKSAIATIEREFVLEKIGKLSNRDIEALEKLLEIIC